MVSTAAILSPGRVARKINTPTTITAEIAVKIGRQRPTTSQPIFPGNALSD